jgi:two-component system cell cycle sensor histidine kinase/response regulator CckA
MGNKPSISGDIGILTAAIQEIANGNLNVSLDAIEHPEMQPVVTAARGMIDNLKSEFQKALSMGASLRNLVESIPVAMVKWSSHGDIVMTNRAAVTLWGYADRQEMISRYRMQDLFSSLEEFKRFMQATVENGAVYDFELNIQKRNGECRLTSCIAAVLRDENKAVSGFVGTFRDVKDQREMEAQLMQMEKLESIRNFASGLAHDLNNILCVILPSVEILRRSMAQRAEAAGLSEKENRLLDSVDKSAQCAVTLARQLMSFSRRSPSSMAVINLNLSVMDCLHQLKQSLGSGIKIETELADDLWNVEADHAQLEEVLIHLGKNAQQAMSGNGILRVATQNTVLKAGNCVRLGGLPPGPYVQLTVGDTGRGIAPEHLYHIFDPFFDEEGTGRGNGLALSMVFGIVKNHKGCIEVESNLGLGTTFKIYWPRTEKKESVAAPSRPPAVHRPHRILVVDDEALVRETIAQMLIELDYEIHAVQDGDEAFMRLNQGERYDLVILDMQMPRMGGPETLTRLREIQPSLKIIMTSGNCPSENVQDFLQRHQCGFLQKPFRLADISRVVQATLSSFNNVERPA